jgi:hypothetical protein
MTDLVGSFLNIFAVGAQRAVADANTRISKVNAESSNKVRQAQNALSASEHGLARFVQSINNNRILDAGGQQLEANVVNYRRTSDQLLTQSFADSIGQAEQAGAAAAAAAQAGIGGGVVDMVDHSTRLRDSIVNEASRVRGEVFASDTSRRAASIMSQTVGGMDQSLILDQMDFNQDYATQYAKPGYGPAVLDFAINAAKAWATMGASEATSGSSASAVSGSGFRTPAQSAAGSAVKFGFNVPAPSYWGNSKVDLRSRTLDPLKAIWNF